MDNFFLAYIKLGAPVIPAHPFLLLSDSVNQFVQMSARPDILSLPSLSFNLYALPRVTSVSNIALKSRIYTEQESQSMDKVCTLALSSLPCPGCRLLYTSLSKHSASKPNSCATGHGHNLDPHIHIRVRQLRVVIKQTSSSSRSRFTFSSSIQDLTIKS